MAPDVGSIVSIAILLVLVLGPLAWALQHYALLEDLRTARRILRIDAAAAAVGAVLIAGSAALVAIAWVPSAPVTTIVLAGVLVLGAVGIAAAVGNLDWYLASRSLPVSSPDDVEPGPIQLEGRAVPLDQLTSSSVTSTSVLAYRAVTLEEYAVLGRGYAASRLSPVSVADDAVTFGVVDAEVLGDAAPAGRELPAALRSELDDPDVELPPDVRPIAVDGAAAEYPLLSPTSWLVTASPAGSTLGGLERTIPAEPGTTAPIGDDLDPGTRPRPRQYSERRIDPGDPVYVLGTARETPEGGIEIVADPDGPPLIVARVTADVAKAHARRFTLLWGLFGAGAMAGAAAALASMGL